MDILFHPELLNQSLNSDPLEKNKDSIKFLIKNILEQSKGLRGGGGGQDKDLDDLIDSISKIQNVIQKLEIAIEKLNSQGFELEIFK